jgi:hypothetical protein
MPLAGSHRLLRAAFLIFTICFPIGSSAVIAGASGKASNPWPERLTAPFAELDADSARSARAILLESGSFMTDTGPGRNALERVLPAELRGAHPDEGGWLIVQFAADLPFAERRATLRRAGAEAGPYVPRNAHLARVPAGGAAALAGQDDVRWMGRLHAGLKLSPHLADPELARWEDGSLRLRLTIGDGAAREAVAQSIRRAGAELDEWTGDGALVTVGSVQAVVALARAGEVLYVEPYEHPKLLNDSSRGITQSSEIGNDSVHLQGVRGDGQIIAVMDSGLDVEHCCFDGAGKVVDNRAWGGGVVGALCGGDHGTHVSGTVACSNAGDHDGLAPDAQLIMQDIQGGSSFACLFGSVSPPGDLASAWSDARSRGAYVHTNSWGGGGNSYGGSARKIDVFMWENQDFLIMYAAGNSGSGSGTLSAYSNAKNSLTVGGTVNGSNFDDMYGASSRGPAGDGRMLPDLLTPARGVSSARNRSTPSCGWTTYSGTSMAAPAAAGSAGLIREYFVDGYYPSGAANAADGFTPSAALVKATMLASTRNMLGSGTRGDRPNSDQGFGRVTVDDALWFSGEPDAARLAVLDDRNMATGLSSAGESDTFELRPTALQPLKLMLVWTDAPGTVGAAKALVNDLDLEITTADGSVYRGNQGFEGGWTVRPSDEADRLNNKEAVFLEGAALGPIDVEVLAASIGDVGLHPQDYALVAVGPLDRGCTEALPEGPGSSMELERDGDDVLGSWADTGAARYLVYRGDSPDFLRRPADPLDDDVTDSDPGQPGVQWRDAGAAATGGNYFYVSAGANGCGQLVP